VLWLLSLTGVTIAREIVLALAMIAIGVLLLAGGRLIARSGLIGLGVVTGVLALALSVTPESMLFSAGDRTHTVTDIADLDANYRLGAGSLTIDLRGLELPAGTTEVTAGVSMGELIIHVPPEATVEGEGRAAPGEVVTLLVPGGCSAVRAAAAAAATGISGSHRGRRCGRGRRTPRLPSP
jgi:hypothetical protein